MIAYLDTSIILRRLLNHPEATRDWGRWDAPYSSDLLRVEAFRTFDRIRREGGISEPQLAQVIEEFGGLWEELGRVAVTAGILRRAADAFPVVVKTLDALHLASAAALAEELREPVVFYTHDARQGMAARAMGFAVRA